MKPDTAQDKPAGQKADDTRIVEKQFSNAIIDSILGVFYVLDVSGNFVRDNRYHQAVLGYSAEEILQMNALDTIAEEDRDLIDEKIREVFEKGFTTVSAHILTKDGRKIPYLFTGYPTEMEGKLYLVGMGVDISERVKAEQEVLKAYEQLSAAEEKLRSQYEELKTNEELLKQSEEKFRVLADTLPAAIMVYKGEDVRYVNDYAARLSGYTKDELLHRKFWEGVHPDYRELTRERGLARQRGEKVPTIYEMKTIDKSGKEHWDLLSSGIIEYEGGPAVIVTLTDITDRKRMEEISRENERKFRVLAETSTAGIFVYQGENFTYVNPAMEKITGYSQEELLEAHFWDWVHPDYQSLVKERGLARQREEEVPSGYEIKIITKAGEIRWVVLTAGLVDYAGRPAGLATIFDITDRKLAEEAREEAKNQAELFLDLMGHDISNMNQIGVGYLEMAQEVMSLDETTRELISRPLETLYDSSRLIGDVNKLQRITTCEIKLEKTDVSQKLRDVVEAYRSRPGFKTMIRHSPFSECQVMANEMLYDALANVVWDCIKYAPADNVIDITLAMETKEGKQLCRVLIDNRGHGLSDEQKTRLFERPRKGMKRTGGRGIGLYLAKSIIDRFRGTFRVEDLVPRDYTRGTRFIIELPACE